MQRKLPWCVVLFCTFLLSVEYSKGEVVTRDNETLEKTPRWETFEMDDIEKKLKESKRSYRSFLNIETMSAGLYYLPKGAVDTQTPHRQDEIYYVISGQGKMKFGEGDDAEDRPLKEGSVIFVKAGEEHRFHSITEDLKLLVFFSTAKSEK